MSVRPIYLDTNDEGERWRLPLGTILVRVHDLVVCQGPCVFHYPTNHILSHLPLLWREDRQMFERVCMHSIGHPDPDQFEYWNRMSWTGMTVHGCDGCCWNQPWEHEMVLDSPSQGD